MRKPKSSLVIGSKAAMLPQPLRDEKVITPRSLWDSESSSMGFQRGVQELSEANKVIWNLSSERSRTCIREARTVDQATPSQTYS